MRRVYLAAAFVVSLGVPAGAQTVTVLWDATSGAEGYRIYRDWQPMGTTTSTSFQLSVQPGISHLVSVTAFNAWGESLPSSVAYLHPTEQCNVDGSPNGVDEDKDGTVDEGCAVPPPPETCRADGFGNGVDEDGDGQIDEGCMVQPSGDTISPTINSLTARRNGNSSNFAVTASASDNVGIVAMDFFVDGVFVARLATSPWSVTLKIQQRGTHLVEVKAIDAAGNVGSASVTVSR